MADAKGVYKQDMVVSTRYRNDLPPPPMPPKLLNIDTGGIEQYLTPGFAAAMSRREEPNIEPDAEGGMPIDMIGIPGYFLGDESAIMAPEHQPLLDPADMALMATPDQLRNASGKASNVSFLRRTQYISAAGAAKVDNMFRTTTMRPKPLKAGQPDPQHLSRDDPVYIKRYIRKGFDIAYPESKQAANKADPQGSLPIPHAEMEAWRNPIHPDNHKLKPVDFYPLLPDLDSFPAQGGYTSLKFDKPPVSAQDSGKRDERIDVALLQAAVDQEHYPAYQQRLEAYESNPEVYEHPGETPFNLALHIPKDSEDVPRIKTVFNNAHPSKDANPTVDGNPEQFEYGRQRVYAIANRSSLQENTYRSVALTLFDPTSTSLAHSRLKSSNQKAAYYYPIQQIMKLRSKPINTLSRPEESGVSDAVTLMVHDPDEEKIKARTFHKAQVDSLFKKEYEEKYPKEPTPPPDLEAVPASTSADQNGDTNMNGIDDDDEKGAVEQALKEAATGVVDGRNGGGGDADDDDDEMDAEGEADESE
ncbi:putative paf1 was identified by affinity chromatography [Phaeomoniella chlamydospora]|uniref:Putative paf1 was identified by affinity chromatography n=1 Tax=Phaeomoniella chlamydospora TaxID=158046 RepID=A0A0G2EYH3_PHACM|nr:putative paf1 was identified by affinity chromatography [Phaeomoniella chlamydospora]